MALTDNIIAAWPLTANSTDATGNGYNGTDTSISYSAAGAAFNGTTSKIVITDAAGLKPIDAWSFSFEAKGTGTDDTIFQSFSQNTVVAGINAKFSGAGKAEMASGKNTNNSLGSGFQISTSTTTCNDNTSRFITCVYDQSNLIIYVNGTAEDTTAWTSDAVYAATNYVRIGCRNNTGTDVDYFAGTIKNLNFWSRALSSTEVTELYNSGTPLVYPFSTFTPAPMMHMMGITGGLM